MCEPGNLERVSYGVSRIGMTAFADVVCAASTILWVVVAFSAYGLSGIHMYKTVATVSTPWARWKGNPQDALWLALMTAGLGTAGFMLFLFMFVSDPHRLLLTGSGFFVVLFLFFLGASALNAYLLSHPRFSLLVSSSGETAKREID